MSPNAEPTYLTPVTAAVDTARDDLIGLSRTIHADPELNYEEQHAAALLSDYLERQGFAVERGIGGVETAFAATIEGGAGDGPSVAILVEYDALPGIGHGCGHNLIALSTVGAGIGVKAALADLPGRVVVIGTPAEEGGGGKIRLLEADVFAGIDIALSSHPASNQTVVRTDVPLETSLSLAMVGYRYAFHGRAAHAAVAPEHGVNALNAVIQLFSGIDAIRQHLRDDVRMHGVITDGGVAPNVVPDFAAANFMLRSRDRDYLREVVVERVQQIASGAALATGARLEVEPFYPLYENVRPNMALATLARDHALEVGMRLDDPPPARGGGGSTDFGNVSQVLPSFAMMFAISEEPVAGHSIAMTEACITDLAHANAIAVAKTLALTACDLLADPERIAAAQAEFAQRG